MENRLDMAWEAFYPFTAVMGTNTSDYHWAQIEKKLKKLNDSEVPSFIKKIKNGNFGRSIGFIWNYD